MRNRGNYANYRIIFVFHHTANVLTTSQTAPCRLPSDSSRGNQFDMTVDDEEFTVRWESFPAGFSYVYVNVHSEGVMDRNVRLEPQVQEWFVQNDHPCSFMELEVIGVKEPQTEVSLGYLNNSKRKSPDSVRTEPA